LVAHGGADLAFLNYILAQKTVPAVLSTSYGEDEQTVPLSFAKRVCSLYAQLGARGVSVLHASGDGGVTGSTVNGYCEANDGKKTVRMLPTFPASCPYVTAVGATQPSTKLGFAEEVVSPYSSGGFSDYFKRPSWQAAQVTNYLKQSKVEKTFANLFSSTGRAYPDISLLGTYYAIVLSGGREQVYGTSCSVRL
jgi:tripeptidyl-peptidase-1